MILVRRETNPDDYHGMVASQGILTSAGGTNSHAAVVARGEGIPAVCGADAIRIDRKAKKVFTAGNDDRQGGRLDHDRRHRRNRLRGGARDRVLGARGCDPRATSRPRRSTLWQAFERFMERRRRTTGAWRSGRTPTRRTNRRTPGSAGRQGIGLCRTEHMFLGEERVAAVRQMIFADTRRGGGGRVQGPAPAAAQGLRSGSSRRWTGSRSRFACWTRRCTSSSRTTSTSRSRSRSRRPARRRMSKKKLAETQGHLDARYASCTRPTRCSAFAVSGSGSSSPVSIAMQVRAIVEAAVKLKKKGKDPRPEIMIPLVATAEELQSDARRARARGRRTIVDKAGVDLHIQFGTMIELPRAAVTRRRDRRACRLLLVRNERPHADRRYGFSRDDIGKFLALYEERSWSAETRSSRSTMPGVGRLMQIAVDEGREANLARARHLRRARRRPGLGVVLREARPRLRVVLAVPGADGAPGRGPSRAGRSQDELEVTISSEGSGLAALGLGGEVVGQLGIDLR